MVEAFFIVVIIAMGIVGYMLSLRMDSQQKIGFYEREEREREREAERQRMHDIDREIQRQHIRVAEERGKTYHRDHIEDPEVKAYRQGPAAYQAFKDNQKRPEWLDFDKVKEEEIYDIW